VTRSTRGVFIALAVLAECACGGGSGSSSPSAPSASAPSAASASPSSSNTPASLTVLSVSATVELTSTGATYHNKLTVQEMSGQTGATITAIKLAFASATRTGSTTFDSSDNITTTLAAGGNRVFGLDVNSTNGADLFTSVVFTITYTDARGVAGAYTSGSSSIAPPVATPAPSSSSYDVTLSATCTAAGKNSNGRAVFTVVQSGTATSPDAGAFLDIALIQVADGIVPTQVTCGSWTPDSGVSCRRAANQPATSSWTATVQSYPAGSSVELAVTLLDRTGGARAKKTSTVPCN